MKKTGISILAMALVAGSAATTFAAANPFSDVPADHWAYDAVSQLAKDGVVEGYGDGTYRGEQTITRYEMAQMTARAMAKTDVSAADQAAIDKLAAEFGDELSSLGVRVAALEKKTDNVKWSGELRYRYRSRRDYNNSSVKRNTQYLNLRLYMTAAVNEHWSVKSRVDYRSDMDSSANAVSGGTVGNENEQTFELDQAYAEGVYGDTVIRLGKLPVYSQADQGMVMDDVASGAMVTFGHAVKVSIFAGRYQANSNSSNSVSRYKDLLDGYAFADFEAENYQFIEVTSDPQQRFTWGLGYHHFPDRLASYSHHTFSAGLGYRFSPDWALHGAYAAGTHAVAGVVELDSRNDKAYSIELDYKGANPARPGSFGIYAAYRYLGYRTAICPTYDTMRLGQRGWDVGVRYTFQRNMMGTLAYFRGKALPFRSGYQEKDASTLFGQLEFFF